MGFYVGRGGANDPPEMPQISNPKGAVCYGAEAQSDIDALADQIHVTVG